MVTCSRHTLVPCLIFVFDLCFLNYVVNSSASYVIDDSDGLGRTFDGIGGISGGGATSKLLVNYQEPLRSQILDFLFKPKFGASLQMLKVEIGGDSQSTGTAGSETSHMHTETDENYHRGYEWWLMKEAKRRNPNILLYGLPWVFPGWLGGPKLNPYSNRTKLVTYILNWVNGAKREHNLTIDFLGIWNERTCDTEYIKMLRKALDTSGHHHIQIVAADSAYWDFFDDFLKDPALAASINIFGIHYPGIVNLTSPVKAIESGRQIWASEEFSVKNDLAGGGCWARVLTEEYVRGFYSAYISWNLIASYYDAMAYTRNGLMTANEPWGGHYDVASPIWITAHVTQFTDIGWRYLGHGSGVGYLKGNGTFVALTSPDRSQLTLFLQTMDPADAPCFYPMPKFSVSEKQSAAFELKGTFVFNGSFSLELSKNEVYTLSTVADAIKGTYPEPPGYKPFPVPYFDDFEGYPEFGEAYNFAQQAGAFEIRQSNDPKHGKVMVAIVQEPPVDTCAQPMLAPVNVIGNYNWTNVDVQIDVYIPSPPEGTTGVVLATRVSEGGCDTTSAATGVFFWISLEKQLATIRTNYSKASTVSSKHVNLKYDRWYTLSLRTQGQHVQAFIDNLNVFDMLLTHVGVGHGFVGVGTETYAVSYFDNFKVNTASPDTYES